ncbi:transposase [Microscilla marina ATCC 23134]|uniref:Transposase n=1 Tax=Microscilla marina ATCC 23134 TaxID=313606 RepID=A1ZYS2_MICM2|nr:transposase [Microscilla marina ATCC 23134]
MRSDPKLSIAQQCKLLGITRSSYYYEPLGESAENLYFMRLMDEQYLQTPFYSYRLMWARLRSLGHEVNKKCIRRLYKKMGLEAIYPKPDLSRKHPEHQLYPYLLRNVSIERPNQVWSTDITYVPMKQGFLYLVAVMDWYSRYVLAWELSNSLEMSFCLNALDSAFQNGQPEIFNTDQGTQFTANAFVKRLLDKGIQVSMDGKGRALDNIFIERLWRDVKCNHIYIYDYEDGLSLYQGLKQYFILYNERKPHSALTYKTSAQVYFQILE